MENKPKTHWPEAPQSTGLYQFMAHKGQAFWQPVDQQSPSNPPPSQAPSPKQKYLFVLMGQSNCQSANLGPKTEADSPHPRVFQLSRGMNKGYSGGAANTWILAQDPLQHRMQHHEQSVGFGLTFAKNFLNHVGPDDEVYLLCCALGGTGFQPSGFIENQKYTWDPNQPHFPPYMTNLFTQALDDTNQVLKSHPDLRLEAVLWHQGENDAYLSEQQYSQHLTRLVQEFRDKVKSMDKNVLFVCGSMMESWRNMLPHQGVHNAQKNVKNYIWLSEFANLDGIANNPFDQMDPGDGVHFSASAQRQIGERMYTAYAKVRAEKDEALEAWRKNQANSALSPA